MDSSIVAVVVVVVAVVVVEIERNLRVNVFLLFSFLTP